VQKVHALRKNGDEQRAQQLLRRHGALAAAQQNSPTTAEAMLSSVSPPGLGSREPVRAIKNRHPLVTMADVIG
jgi:hypothetical protein